MCSCMAMPWHELLLRCAEEAAVDLNDLCLDEHDVNAFYLELFLETNSSALRVPPNLQGQSQKAFTVHFNLSSMT